MTDTLLTIREAASDAGVTVRTIQRWIAGGLLPARLDNGRRFIDWADLNRAEAATRRPSGHRRNWTREISMS